MRRRRGHDGYPPTLKRLGQHFLTDPVALRKIVDALDPTPSSTVVEVGPGRGALTEELRARSGKVVAIELDHALASILRERYAGDSGISIVEADVLQTSLGDVAGDDYLLVGNVPYYITTPILFHALAGALPTRAVFLVQREVGERAVAPAGSRIYGALSVNLQVLTSVERVFDIPAGAFRPPPRVESTVIRLAPLTQPLISREEQREFQRFVQALFSQRRKQLGTIVRSLAGAEKAASASDSLPERVEHVERVEGVSSPLERLGIDPMLRPERLTPAQFVALFRAVRQGE